MVRLPAGLTIVLAALAVGCGAPADGVLAARATVRWGACPLPGAEALGCWDGATVWLDPSLQSAELAPLAPRVVAHEVGHWLRGDGHHLALAAAGGPCYDHGRGPDLHVPERRSFGHGRGPRIRRGALTIFLQAARRRPF